MAKILKPLAVGVFVITGVMAIIQLQNTRAPSEQRTDLSIIRSPDENCQIKLTGGWVRDPMLSNEASIKVTNAKDQMHVMVISYSKSELGEEVTFDKFTEASLDLKRLRLSSAIASPPIRVRINGKQGRQYLLTGDENSTNISYLVTIVESISFFHEVIAWTPSSLLGPNQARLQEITETFRATD